MAQATRISRMKLVGTPLNLSYDHEMFFDYINSKTLAEKEVLSYNGKGIELVSVACGLVGGDTIQSFMSGSIAMVISQTLNDEFNYRGLKYSEEVLSKIPIVHVQDVSEAHIFSMENSDINGRFLCVSAFLKTAEMASVIRKLHPDITIRQEFIEDTKNETRWGSTKPQDLGFRCKCDAKKIIDDSILCAKRFGNIV